MPGGRHKEKHQDWSGGRGSEGTSGLKLFFMVSWGEMGETGLAGMEHMNLNNFSRPHGAETEPGYLVPGPRQGRAWGGTDQ